MDEFENYFDDLTPSALTPEDVERIADRRILGTLAAIEQSNAQVQQQLQSAEKARQDAIAKAEANLPGFRDLYSGTAPQRIIKEHPALARLIWLAETSGDSDAAYEVYESFYNRARREGLVNTAPERSRTETVSGNLTLAQINALPPEQRRAHIEALGQRVEKIPVDVADDSEEGKRTRRY